MNKQGGIFAYIFWIVVGIVIGVYISLTYLIRWVG